MKIISTLAFIFVATYAVEGTPILQKLVKSATKGKLKDVMSAGAGAVAGPLGSAAVEMSAAAVKRVAGVKMA
jgi:hypothetical protein